MSEKSWVVYLVRCVDKSLYCGISNDVHSRLKAHNAGRGAKYTRSRRPVKLAGCSPAMSKREALRLEYRIKKMPAARKISEMDRIGHELEIQRDLRSLRHDIRTIVKIIDKLIKEI